MGTKDDRCVGETPKTGPFVPGTHEPWRPGIVPPCQQETKSVPWPPTPQNNAGGHASLMVTASKAPRGLRSTSPRQRGTGSEHWSSPPARDGALQGPAVSPSTQNTCSAAGCVMPCPLPAECVGPAVAWEWPFFSPLAVVLASRPHNAGFCRLPGLVPGESHYTQRCNLHPDPSSRRPTGQEGVWGQTWSSRVLPTSPEMSTGLPPPGSPLQGARR